MADKKDSKKPEKKPKLKKEAKRAETVTITDDCLAPGRDLYIVYKGPNPVSIATKLTSSFQPFFRISSAGWGEPDFRWDTSGEPIGFYIKWWVKKAMSGSANMVINFLLQGDENSQTKQGKFTLQVTPVIEHRFSDNWLVRSLFWIYDYMFYGRVRQEYIKYCRQISHSYVEYLKGEMGLGQSPVKGVTDVHRM